MKTIKLKGKEKRKERKSNALEKERKKTQKK